MLTERIGRITPSATLAMTAKAAELRAAGKPVINLSVGEPDFPTPINIRLAGQRAIEEGHTRYTPGGGTMELKKRLLKNLAETITCIMIHHKFLFPVVENIPFTMPVRHFFKRVMK